MKVGRFGLGFKSVFHMTGNAKYLPSKPKIKIVFWRFFFLSVALSAPKTVQKRGDQQSAMSALRETT